MRHRTAGIRTVQRRLRTRQQGPSPNWSRALLTMGIRITLWLLIELHHS